MITISVAGGSRTEILHLVKKVNEEYPENVRFKVFDTTENIATDSMWDYVHCESELEMAQKAVELVASGEAQILLKGIIPTHTILKELLNKKHDLKTRKVLSHAALINIPKKNRAFILTDSAMNIAPTTETMIEIVENVKQVAKKTGIDKPKIALLSSAESFNPKMPSSVLATEVTEHFKETEDAVIYGPISFDLATSKESAEHKNFQGPIVGDADVLVVPTIDTGNTLYKALTIFGDATAGGIIVGTKVPVVLTSRSDSTESKFDSLKFAMQQL
ncbi:phosphotransacetylase [Vagococcus sp. DIV0080]|uniref:Phosphotransacetylase n=1 Tax=Candidatus Vagococcus giribetii TaxID=2230876 RepID=A0ABS3HQU9_9ENTE|nr:phosphate acyltransferase [Vagococcus sp. DIV0080]MBO0476129.1 phosphotransacetylase [Vagococcus sp. DIV0080]